jgi:hypothetical protein
VAIQGWLEPNLRSLLSQGDIFEGLPFSKPLMPLTPLVQGTGKGGKVIWSAGNPPANQPNRALYEYRIGHGMVVSHDCAIDKPNAGSRILFAPVASLLVHDVVTQDAVRRQAHLAAMLIPDVPGIGDAYADLRLITPFPYEFVAQITKIASLTDAARDRLQQALIAFFVYRQAPPNPKQ